MHFPTTVTVLTPIPHDAPVDHQLPCVVFVQRGQTARERGSRDCEVSASRKMDGVGSAETSEERGENKEGKLNLGRKIWEAWAYTEIEIEKSPEEVREKFLDFEMIPQYHAGFIVSLSPRTPGHRGIDLQPGDRMCNELGGIKAHPTIIHNTPTEFKWRGPWPYTYLNLLCGYHTFKFLPSPINPGHTWFIHEEVFTGPLSFVMGMSDVRKKTMEKFYRFNEDLKWWVEMGLPRRSEEGTRQWKSGSESSGKADNLSTVEVA